MKDFLLLKENPPEEPGFPFFMLVLALIKDIADLLIISSLIFGLIYFPISMMWTYTRSKRISFGSKVAIKLIRKRVVKRMVISGAAETIPALGILPLATVFVLLNHYSETKMVRVFLQAVEIIEKSLAS